METFPPKSDREAQAARALPPPNTEADRGAAALSAVAAGLEAVQLYGGELIAALKQRGASRGRIDGKSWSRSDQDVVFFLNEDGSEEMRNVNSAHVIDGADVARAVACGYLAGSR